jgi:mannitol 2-dehydrogenase
MKMRLLNGSHLAMAYLGALAGVPLVHEVMRDSLFHGFIERFMDEVTPIVPVIPGTDVREYKKTLLERFSNPTINDQVTRICSEGSAKLPKWLLPSIVELMDKCAPTGLLTLVVASWIFYLGRGVDESGKPLEIMDARAAELGSIAKQALADPTPMLLIRSIFGERLSSDRGFNRAVAAALQALAGTGVRATMQQYLSGSV